MDLTEIFSFKDQALFAVEIGLFIFIVGFYTLSRFFVNKQKGVALAISLVMAIITAFNLYSNEFYGWQTTLAVVLYVLVILTIIRVVLWPFIKFLKNRI